MNTYPTGHQEVKAGISMPNVQPTGDVFRVGRRGDSYDFSSDDVRYYAWYNHPITKESTYASILAGWTQLPVKESQDGALTYVELPEGTRNASSVLGGVESFNDHDLVLERILKYQKTLFNRVGLVDMAVSLDSVAVTRDGDIYIMPPHVMGKTGDDRALWFETFSEEILEVLSEEDNTLHSFMDKIESTYSAIEERK